VSTPTGRQLRVGAVQAAPVFLDAEATTDKACALIEEAGSQGIAVLGFPEGFIPTHPDWYHFLPASSARSFEFARRLFDSAVEIPSPTTDRLARAAARAKVNVVIGLCERTASPDLTLYNTQLFIGSDGTLLGKHQKIMPTLGERVVHARGAGDGLRAFTTPVARLSGLICGENSNPLAIMALAADRPDIHVASWPSPVSRDEGGMSDLIRVASQSLAYATGSFVISAQAVVDDAIVAELAQGDADRSFLSGQVGMGSSLIAAPNRAVIAGPPDGPFEGIVGADIDLKAVVTARHIHDFAGHYNRPDIFQLHVNRGPGRLVETVDGTSSRELPSAGSDSSDGQRTDRSEEPAPARG
jgi:aliphatic nitrilase